MTAKAHPGCRITHASIERHERGGELDQVVSFQLNGGAGIAFVIERPAVMELLAGLIVLNREDLAEVNARVATILAATAQIGTIAGVGQQPHSHPEASRP
jgi:hypothetical protein